MMFDVEKRIFFTKKLYELKSVTLVQRAYRQKCPTKATILNLSRKFDRTGSLLDLPPKPINERETRIEARIRLKILFTEDPSLSNRKPSVDVGIQYSLCRDIFLKDLRLKPFKYQSAHQLLQLDCEKGLFLLNAGQAWQRALTSG